MITKSFIKNKSKIDVFFWFCAFWKYLLEGRILTIVKKSLRKGLGKGVGKGLEKGLGKGSEKGLGNGFGKELGKDLGKGSEQVLEKV